VKSRCYRARPGGGFEGLQLHTEDVPAPIGRQALVRVVATSLNYRERMILMQGRYSLPLRPDLIPVCDGAGEVVALGPEATRLHVGERVAASVFPRWIDGPFSRLYADQLGGSLDGMLTEYTVLDEDALVLIPAHLSYEEAAAFPCAGVTAWNALTWGSPLAPGQSVLVLGSGSVSLFALQFAKLFGARAIVTTSSAQKAQSLRELGADEVIDRNQTPDWDRAVRELTSGQGVDRVVEVGGGATLAQSIAATATEGRIALVGAVATGSIEPSALSAGVYTMYRLALGSRAHFIAMNRAVAASGLRPVIDRTFAFGEAPAAFDYFFERDRIGKVVIRVAD
jgi:NADPH:quinone reductase-like Zn-dependent oxidoreductase